MNEFNTRNTLFFLLLLFSTSACYIDLDDDDGDDYCIDGKGAIETETYQFEAFTEITNTIDADIYVTTGSSNHRVSIDGKHNVVDHIDVYTRGNELVITSSRCYDDGDVVIDIALFELQALFNTGSGDLFGTNTWETDDITLNLSGSGRIDAILDVERLNQSIAGSGRTTLSGIANEADVSISGSGDLHAFGLIVSDYEVLIAGSGNADHFVLDHLSGAISGSGNIKYKGTPAVIDVEVIGSGRIIEAN